jgi:predicted PurR-regulated permease PerM
MKERTHTSTGGLSRERLLVIALLITTAIAVALSFIVAAPLIPALAWAIALAIVANPLHDRLCRRIQRPDFAAGLSVFLVAVLLLGPTILVIAETVQQAAGATDWLRGEIESGRWQETLNRHPFVAAVVHWVSSRFDMSQLAGDAVQTAKTQGGRALKATFWGVAQLVIALYALFYFLRDRRRLIRALSSFVPLSERETGEVFENVRAMIHATVYGNVATSLLQGTLGGLMFWILGLPGALLWGFAMFVMSLVPTLGSFVVWVPAVVFLAVSGEWWKAVVLLVWGGLVVSTIDNIVYPYLVGRDIRMHTLPVFIALLGGLFVFGAAGLVLGPVILAITFALLDVWRRRTSSSRSAEESS